MSEEYSQAELEKYLDKLQSYYTESGLLKQYPSKKPMRTMALMKILANFTEGQIYTEKQVNEGIKMGIDFSDVELIRRELYQYRMFNRKNDGSEYWVEPQWKDNYIQFVRITSAE